MENPIRILTAEKTYEAINDAMHELIALYTDQDIVLDPGAMLAFAIDFTAGVVLGMPVETQNDILDNLADAVQDQMEQLEQEGADGSQSETEGL